MKVFFIFLFFSIPLSSSSQITSVIGEVGVDEFAHAVTVDDSGHVYLGGARGQKSMIIKFDSNLNTIWSKEVTVSGQSIYNSEIGTLEIIGDTIFGCGWISSGSYNYKGGYYFKMNKSTGAFYWVKTFNYPGYHFSNMRYYDNRFYISGGVFSSSFQHEIKVFCVNSQDGSLAWETGHINVIFSSGVDFNDDIAPMSEIVNGKFFIPGRSYVDGANGGLNMRPTLFGFDINGNMILNKYLLYPESESIHRFYGMDLHFDGTDSLVYTFWGDDNCSSCTSFKGGVAKMDLLGNVRFSKMLDVIGSPSEYMRKSNIGNNSYVFFVEKNYTQNNSSIVLIKTDTEGNALAAKEISLPGSSLKVNCGSSGYAKSSIYLNGFHYFVAQRIVNATGEKDIVLVSVDDNLNTISACFVVAPISINEIAIAPFSSDINILNSPHNINIESPYTANSYSYINSCDTTGINIQQSVFGCDSIQINTSSGSGTDYSVTWPDGTTSDSQVFYSDTTVVLTVFNSSLCCAITDTINLTLSPSNFTMELPNDTIVCMNIGDSLEIVPISTCMNCQYQWSDGSINSTTSANSTGWYYLTMMNPCGVQNSDSIYIEVNLLPSFDLLPDTTVCLSALPINLSSNFQNYDSIIWSNGGYGNSATIQDVGSYNVIAYNSCGFIQDAFVIDTMPSVNVMNILDIDTCINIGESISITPIISNEETIYINNVIANELIVNSDSIITIIAVNQCSLDSISFSIELNYPPVYSSQNIDTCLQEGTAISLSVNSIASNVVWWNGDLNNTIISGDGIYYYTVSNQCGTIQDSIIVSYDSPLLLDLQDSIHYCLNANEGIYITHSDPSVLVYWQPSSQIDSVYVVQSGIYYAEVSNSCGTAYDSVNVQLDRNLILFSPDTIYICNDSISKADIQIVSNYEYLLYDENGDMVSDLITETGDYSIVINSPCQDTTQLLHISFDTAPFFYAPNSFTPDGIGVNNIYEFVGVNYSIIEISIYNKWGQRIYFEEGQFSGWDGTYLGRMCQDETYVVIVKYTSCNDENVIHQLHVNLLR